MWTSKISISTSQELGDIPASHVLQNCPFIGSRKIHFSFYEKRGVYRKQEEGKVVTI